MSCLKEKLNNSALNNEVKKDEVKKCIMGNGKTYKSVDFTTNCPKRRDGKQCKYCYVEAKRDINFNAKKVIDNLTYNGQVLRMTKNTIERLNKIGGLRLFSFGDYMPEQDADILQFLADCRIKGLSVKVVTKVPEFIDKYYNLYEDVFSIIHLSIDNIGDGVPLETAIQYREKYEKVIIRSVILNLEDLEVLEKVSDIITFNHEDIKGKIENSINFKRYPKMLKEFENVYADKMCCISGNCETCSIKCKATNKEVTQ